MTEDGWQKENHPSPVFSALHSVSGQSWRLRNTDERLGMAIAQRHALPGVIGEILAGRGVTLDGAARYLNPSLQADLPDPSCLIAMERAAKRLAAAIMAKEQIAIFGDYDVDGATSSALLMRFLRSVGHTAVLYVPDRITEGYGPNGPALRGLAKQGAKLLITVDCGTMAFEALAEGCKAGLDIIVVDHHQAEAELPQAFAVLNPNRLDDVSGHGQLAAVGVAFLLVVAVNRELRNQGCFERQNLPEPNLLQWLDLVALGTICDVAPLTGVNRALVRQGLKIMAQRKNPGLQALAEAAGVDTDASTYQAGFVFGPRINAGGRVGKSDLGARLLASDDIAEVTAIAAELDHLNRERQAIEAQVLEAALAQMGEPAGSLVLVAGQGWHPGVIGIAASRLKDRSNLPSIVIGIDASGLGRGSGRSITGVDLGAAVLSARQAGLLINGGGHKMAAGLTVEAARIDELRAFLAQRIAIQVTAASTAGGLGLDGLLAAGSATPELFDQMQLAGPFGAGNPEPRFVFANARIVDAGIVGADHVRCVLVTGDGKRLPGIAFRSASTPLGQALLAGPRSGPLHVAGKLRADSWRGVRRVQLHIDDLATL